VALACSLTMTTMNSRGALRGRDGAEYGHERAEVAMVLDAGPRARDVYAIACGPFTRVLI